MLDCGDVGGDDGFWFGFVFSYSIFPTVLLISTRFLRNFCVRIWQHSETHKKALGNRSFYRWQIMNVYLWYVDNLNTFKVHYVWKKRIIKNDCTTCRRRHRLQRIDRFCHWTHKEPSKLQSAALSHRAQTIFILCDKVGNFLKDLFSSRKYTPVKTSVAWKFVHRSWNKTVKSPLDLDHTSVRMGIFSSWELVWILRSSQMSKNKSNRFPDLNSVGHAKFPNTHNKRLKSLNQFWWKPTNWFIWMEWQVRNGAQIKKRHYSSCQRLSAGSLRGSSFYWGLGRRRLGRLEHTCTRLTNNNQRKETHPFYSQTVCWYVREALSGCFIEQNCQSVPFPVISLA